MNKVNPKFIVILGVLFVSFSSILVKSSIAPSLVIAAYRMGFTVLLLTPSLIIKHRKELKDIGIKNIILCTISGMLLAFHFASFMESIKHTSVCSTTVLVDTHPIFVVILGYFIFKDKISKKALSSIIIALAGSILISFADSSKGGNILYGDFLAILGALLFSGYMMIGTLVRRELSLTIYTFLVYLACTIVLFGLCLLSKTPITPYPAIEYIIFLSLAILCTLLGHSIFNWGLKYLKPAFISTAILGEPVFATLWALIFFKEVPPSINLAGSMLILIGIYMYTTADNSTGTNEKSLKN